MAPNLKRRNDYDRKSYFQDSLYIRTNDRLRKARQKKISSQGIIVEVSCKVKLMRHFRRQLFKKFLLCMRVLLFIKGVTQQSDEVIGVTSNEVTRNRVTGKKFKE